VTVPLVDLKTQYRTIRGEVLAAIERVLESGQFILGVEVAGLEEEFAAFCGVRHAVAVHSGTSALHLALLAAGVGPGDEVITVPFTFVSTVAAICEIGARPVLVDVDERYYTMRVDAVEAAITPRTKAIVPVHLYGQAADMAALVPLARHHGLVLVEDAAQAHGAEDRGRRVGSIGDLGCFSFYPAKNLGAYGDGGMVVTNDAGHAERLRLLRNCGQVEKYVHTVRGYNCRLDEIQAAVLRVKLPYLEKWTEARRSRAALYDRLLTGSGVVVPVARAGSRHVYHLYAIRSAERDVSRRQLAQAGIQTGIHYPVPVHLQTGYADLGYRAGDLPISEQLAGEVLSLPMYPELEDAEVETISQAVRASVDGEKR
jgi:dTDP-4-amino-4,6-dideoxygalactose transaminase